MDIERIVEQVQEIVGDGTRVPGFRGKIMVDSDRLLALEEEIRTSVPASIQEATTIISQKESIINQAYLEAQRMKKSAGEEATAIATAARDEHEAKLEESEIVVSSQSKAEEIQSGAMTEAQQIIHDAQRKAYRLMSEAESSAGSKGEGADQYAREVLFNLEERIAETLGQIRRGIDSLNREEPVHLNGNGHNNSA